MNQGTAKKHGGRKMNNKIESESRTPTKISTNRISKIRIQEHEELEKKRKNKERKKKRKKTRKERKRKRKKET